MGRGCKGEMGKWEYAMWIRLNGGLIRLQMLLLLLPPAADCGEMTRTLPPQAAETLFSTRRNPYSALGRGKVKRGRREQQEEERGDEGDTEGWKEGGGGREGEGELGGLGGEGAGERARMHARTRTHSTWFDCGVARACSLSSCCSCGLSSSSALIVFLHFTLYKGLQFDGRVDGEHVGCDRSQHQLRACSARL